MAKELDKKVFEQCLEYCEDSPSGLRWKVDRYTGMGHRRLLIKAGDIAGSINRGFGDGDYTYWVINLNEALYKAHRIIYCLHYGTLSPELQIDHIDGNPLNNRIDNLRAVPDEINRRNLKKYITNTSGVAGVHIQTNKNTGYVRISAFWQEGNKRKTKSFSINKYGYDLAFELACKHREEMIAKLNENGAGYSERHGQ